MLKKTEKERVIQTYQTTSLKQTGKQEKPENEIKNQKIFIRDEKKLIKTDKHSFDKLRQIKVEDKVTKQKELF